MQMRMMKLEELAAEKEAICEVLDAPTRLQVDAKMKYLFDEFETTQLRCSKMESDLSSALIKHQVFELRNLFRFVFYTYIFSTSSRKSMTRV